MLYSRRNAFCGERGSPFLHEFLPQISGQLPDPLDGNRRSPDATLRVPSKIVPQFRCSCGWSCWLTSWPVDHWCFYNFHLLHICDRTSSNKVSVQNTLLALDDNHSDISLFGTEISQVNTLQFLLTKLIWNIHHGWFPNFLKPTMGFPVLAFWKPSDPWALRHPHAKRPATRRESQAMAAIDDHSQ